MLEGLIDGAFAVDAQSRLWVKKDGHWWKAFLLLKYGGFMFPKTSAELEKYPYWAKPLTER